MSSIASVIKITSLPHGDAPEWVRRAWIGCIMPCEPECGHIPVYVESVLPRKDTGPIRAVDVLNGTAKPSEKIAGFSVPTDKAIQVLLKKSPRAARWFRENGYPKDGIAFRFKNSEVKVIATVPEGQRGKMTVYDDMETGTMRPIN